MKISAEKRRLLYDTHLSNISSALCISGSKYASPNLRDDVRDVEEVPTENNAVYDSIRTFYGRNCQRTNSSDLATGFYHTSVEDYVWCFFGGYGIKHCEMEDKPWIDMDTDNHPAAVVTSVTRIHNVLESAGESEYDIEEQDEETRRRNGHRLCKMCRINEACIVFLAYCHLVSCDRCSNYL